ncbi:MAG: methylmalonyl-CoA mutase family protein [Smithellaceae bacterium]|nr:methylmalonyl-CoA mutase family protein [Smithellaceae bacterium]
MCNIHDQEKLAADLKVWEEKTDEQLKKTPEARSSFETLSGLPVKALYTPLDAAERDYQEDLAFPGIYPFTRGIQNTMYRGRFWTMRQYAGYGSAEDTNKRFHYLLERGQTGLSLAFDLPTQIGYDSDHPMALGEVGRVGVAIDTIHDLDILFHQIPLDQVSASMTINSPAAILTAMYLARAERDGISADKLRGTIQNDVLKEYIARGTYIFPIRHALRLTADILGFCALKMPNWNSISISGYHMREAGCTAVQEVAFTMANAITYVETALNAGLKIDDIGPRLSFFFSAHQDFFEEVAKFRAARRLWARLMKERFGAKNPRSWMLRYHVQTAGCSLTAQQPILNILRTGYEGLSAVLGGCQSLHTNSYDEALALPSEQAAQIALRTQQVIAHEIGVTETADPLAGSYYVESLTDDIEAEANKYIGRIEEMGGTVAAISAGYIQEEISRSAYEYQKNVEARRRIVVGLNKYQVQEPRLTGLHKVDPGVGEAQAKRLEKIRAERSARAVTAALDEIRRTAKTDENLMPPIIEAVRADATVGEICGALRDVFGEYIAVNYF